MHFAKPLFIHHKEYATMHMHTCLGSTFSCKVNLVWVLFGLNYPRLYYSRTYLKIGSFEPSYKEMSGQLVIFKGEGPRITLSCVNSVGYCLELGVAITLHRHYRFFYQPSYIIFVSVHTNYTKYDI